ncbi:serine/threonine-protein kinase pelle-like [Tropilaelaps mercedesae]|uniref:Serine/threonine-protein kinase pelle-like n=1 Tax=Tropilaelaps mercedesae TaxID=418985 RepID=A0A1V9XX87_9ACAR|nr:serine/threonine-protein kinase pelle-like [Tropilaelaps mercedesae]
MADSQHGVPRSPRTTRSMPSSPNAHRSTERPVYIYKLPYCSYYQLCRHLDADKQWDVLAGLMRMDPVDIKLFANATLRGGSPADEVLKKFGERNGRISQSIHYTSNAGRNLARDTCDKLHSGSVQGK